MLSVDDVVKGLGRGLRPVDHEGRPQPPFAPTVTENLGDLGWHEEFELRRSFAYTVVAGPLRAGDPYAADIRRDVPLGGGGSVDRTTG